MPFEGVDSVDVVGVYNPGGAETPEELGEEVDGEAPPGELAVQTEAECYGRIEKATAVTRDVDSEHDA